LAVDDEQLAPAFGADRTIGTAHFGPQDPPPRDARERHIRTESVMIAHRASEARLRLFFAHVEHEECPRLGMSASTDGNSRTASGASKQPTTKSLADKRFHELREIGIAIHRVG
jgi:hypothetical protein